LGYSFRGDGDPHPADYLPLLWWFQLPAIPAPVGYGLSAQLCRRFAVAVQRLPNTFSRAVRSASHLFYAHCQICGNLNLQRISADRVPGAMSFFGRILDFPALRCVSCRHKFFSVRPLRPSQKGVAAAQAE